LRSAKHGEVPVQLIMRSDGARVRMAVFDATEQIRAEKELARLEAERRRFEREEAVLLTAHETRDRFLAMLGHELRTPLAPILAAVSSLSEMFGAAPEAKALLALIRRNVIAERRLIDDLVDVARIEHGKLRLEVEIVDVHEVIREVADQATGAPGSGPPI